MFSKCKLDQVQFHSFHKARCIYRHTHTQTHFFLAFFGFHFDFWFLWWGIVDLQCCVSFRRTATWISYTYTYVHSFLDSFPYRPLQSFEFTVLSSRSLLINYFIYSSLYMSIPITHLFLKTALWIHQCL